MPLGKLFETIEPNCQTVYHVHLLSIERNDLTIRGTYFNYTLHESYAINLAARLMQMNTDRICHAITTYAKIITVINHGKLT